MTDAEFDAQVARLDALRNKWVPLLGLGDWRFVWAYHRTETPEIKTDSGANAIGTTDVNWKYLEAHIAFWMPEVAAASDDYLERIFVHELMHVVLNEMRADKGKNDISHEERVATVLAQAFIRTLQGD